MTAGSNFSHVRCCTITVHSCGILATSGYYLGNKLHRRAQSVRFRAALWPWRFLNHFLILLLWEKHQQTRCELLFFFDGRDL